MSSNRQKTFSDYVYESRKNVNRGYHILADRSKTFINRKSVLPLLVGLVTGMCFAQLLIFSFPNNSPYFQNDDNSIAHKYDEDRISNGQVIHYGSHFHENGNTTIADQLFNEVSVLCWILTNPENHATKAQAVKNTWGQKCNKLIFMSSEDDTELGAIGLPVSEGRDNLWAKTKEAFKYVYEHHLDQYDWFMKADDDTYVIMENLRKMLYSYSTDFPIYLGCKFKAVVKQGYMSGGAGYVLSREALKRFIEKALPDSTNCRQNADGGEDIELGTCMESVKVIAGDSRDEYERGRMFPFGADHHLLSDPSIIDYWYWKYIYYKSDEGLDCCSDHAISFHYIQPNDMYVLDYLVYHVRPFGIKPASDVLPGKKSLDEIMGALSISDNNSRITYPF